jgi:hypothetical protein
MFLQAIKIRKKCCLSYTVLEEHAASIIKQTWCTYTINMLPAGFIATLANT